MPNNWVLLQGRLCHSPNYSATRRGLHKVAFRLAVPRPPRATTGMPIDHPPEPTSHPAGSVLPPLGPNSDYVTVIIIGKPAWDFKQLDLQTGAAVRVQGHLRSWDVSPEDVRTSGAHRSDAQSSEGVLQDDGNSGEAKGIHPMPRDYRIEVIAEKVDPLNDRGHPSAASGQALGDAPVSV